MGRHALKFAVQSEPGVRANNEDAAFAGPRLLALADGMGGHAAGEVAASLALTQVVEGARHAESDPVTALRSAIARANDAIARYTSTHPETAGMGTTLTALLFSSGSVVLGHAGDSRAYVFREGRLDQLTRDDTFVQSLVDEGRLERDEARSHPRRSMVTKVLTGRDVEPTIEVLETRPRDRFLVCSDGLTDYVPDDTIVKALTVPDIVRCPQELIRLALRHGSTDNVSCAIGEVVAHPSGFDIALTVGAPGSKAELIGA